MNGTDFTLVPNLGIDSGIGLAGDPSSVYMNSDLFTFLLDPLETQGFVTSSLRERSGLRRLY